MNQEFFDQVLERRIGLIREVLASKRKEYAMGGDRLHNFNRAAAMLGISREKALVGMWSKHIVSILDIVDNFGEDCKPTKEMVEEKIGDAINYLVLLEAMLKSDIADGRFGSGTEKKPDVLDEVCGECNGDRFVLSVWGAATRCPACNSTDKT
jgi:hypothetical protein